MMAWLSVECILLFGAAIPSFSAFHPSGMRLIIIIIVVYVALAIFYLIFAFQAAVLMSRDGTKLLRARVYCHRSQDAIWRFIGPLTRGCTGRPRPG